jgi:predicted MFS family arabinose efflux permease
VNELRPAAVLDRGRAWLDMAMATLAMFTVFATAYSFGTFVRPMAAEFSAGRGAIAWVFAVTAFLYFGLGAVTGPLVHKVGPKRMIMFGGVVQVVGMLLTTRATELWHAYITYGIGVGVGVACGYVPMVAVVSGWFEQRRTMAIGIAVSGIGLASLFGAPIAAALVERHGWRHAYLLFAIATAVLLGTVVLFVRTPPGFSDRPSQRLSKSLRSPSFILLYLSMVMAATTLFNVFVNIVPYAEERGVAKVTAALLLSVLGGASVVGRNALALVAKRVGVSNTFTACIGVMGATQLLWLIADGRLRVLWPFVAVFGVAYGGMIALGPMVLVELFGSQQIGGLAGVNYTAAGVGSLAGPTICSWLVDRTGGYTASSLLGFGCGMTGFALLLAMRRFRANPTRLGSAAELQDHGVTKGTYEF